MPNKPIELPPEIARAFVRDMQVLRREEHHHIKADAIAAQQLHALRQHYGGKLRLTDVKEMFSRMKDGPPVIFVTDHIGVLMRWGMPPRIESIISLPIGAAFVSLAFYNALPKNRKMRLAGQHLR
jgi:hypothetical protein